MIEQAGGTVTFDAQRGLLERLVGRHFFLTVRSVDLSAANLDLMEIAELKGLRRLARLTLRGLV